jgi:anti-sigma regulatory factor (Ser/Thr protein kinase)
VDRFRHEALLYSGMEEFVARTLPFLRAGIHANDAILVVVSAAKIDALRRRLGDEASAVQFADMAAVGANPARIIPAWLDFIDDYRDSGRRCRGIGEPIYADRTTTELVECVRHEALLNVAFDGDPAWWLLCPYDTASLPAAVIDEAHRTHPFIAQKRSHFDSSLYPGTVASGAPFKDPLPEPAHVDASLPFDSSSLATIRHVVAQKAGGAGFLSEPISQLVQAVNEVATNSVRHGGGEGTLRIWRDGETMVCEIRDAGHLTDPLAGRRRPGPEQNGGRGLWLANRYCNLVQVRSLADGTIVRLHKHRNQNQ